MVELGRFAQTAALREKGWVQDEECQRLQWAARGMIGGPTYMRAPDEKIYAVGGGIERLLNGDYNWYRGMFPEDAKPGLIRDFGPETISVTFVDGLRTSEA